MVFVQTREGSEPAGFEPARLVNSATKLMLEEGCSTESQHVKADATFMQQIKYGPLLRFELVTPIIICLLK